jgi:hypothetical protein
VQWAIASLQARAQASNIARASAVLPVSRITAQAVAWQMSAQRNAAAMHSARSW